MIPKSEIIIEGSYQYFNKDVNYSQENFKLVHLPESHSYHIYAEILSRIETGEFLKIMVRYEMDNHFHPVFVRVEKSLGNRYALETLKFDINAQELFYNFQNTHANQDFKRSLSAKHYLTSPAFSTAAIFTMSKKFDATGRTAVHLLNSASDWNYEKPPEEKSVYAEYKTHDVQDFRVNGSVLSASHLCLYEHDTSTAANEAPVELYISKHFGIPYQLVQGDLKIMVKTMKRNT